MKYALISVLVLGVCVLALGPLADGIAIPDGVARVLGDVGGIF